MGATVCPECRNAVVSGPVVRRKIRAGLNMSRLHREIEATWHAACFSEAERVVAESRAEVAAKHRADLAALAEAIRQV